MKHDKTYDIPEPVVRRRPGPHESWDLIEDYSDQLPWGATLHIKAGFNFDGLSVKRAVYRILHPMEGPGAALQHDACYAAEIMPRKLADSLLYRNLRREGCTIWQSICAYVAVRLLGGIVWRQHSPDSVAQARKYVSIS